MVDKTTAKILKFIAKNQPCTFEDVGKFLDVDYRYSPHIDRINREHLIYKFDSLPDGKSLIALTPKGEFAIEEYQRISLVDLKSTIAIIIAFLALLKPSNVDFFEFMKRLVQLLIK